MSDAGPAAAPPTDEAPDDRGHWGSRFGFVLAAAGSAVGLGNLWKFPYITYEYGGAGEQTPWGAGTFILIYLLAIAIIGMPVMIAELLIGRRSQKSPVGAFKALKSGTPWWLVGLMAVFTGFVLLSFYGVVAGWSIEYTKKSLAGDFGDADKALVMYVQAQVTDDAKASGITPPPVVLGDGVASATFSDGHRIRVATDSADFIAWEARDYPSALFGDFLSDGTAQIIYLALFMLLTMLIVVGGVSGGIERAAKILMPALLLILLALVATVFTLPNDGAGKALAFMFEPDFDHLTADAVLEAIGHSFFTLSLGMGAMMVYGSYLRKGDNLVKAALAVTVADTLVALIAAFVIFGIIFSFGFKMEGGGAGNLFTAIPAIFEHLPGGGILLPVFYLLVCFAALTSAVSLLEVVASYFIDEKGWARKKAVYLSGTAIFLFGILSALSFSVLSDVTLDGNTLFDLLDKLVSNWLLPLGGLFVALFLGYGMKVYDIAEELGTGPKAIALQMTLWSCRIVAPAAIIVTMVYILVFK